MKIYRARAFAYPTKIEDKEVLGNPASVIVCEQKFPNKKEMRDIAIKENLPITVFVKKRRHGKENEFDIRYFSKSGDEFEICGHGTLVATQILVEIYAIKKEIVFYIKLKNKKIIAKINNGLVSIKIPKFNAINLTNQNIINDLENTLSLQKSDILTVLRCNEVGDLLVEIKNSQKLKTMKPNFINISKYCQKLNIRGLAIICKSDIQDFDYEVRIFFPHLGINEDIVCGSCESSIAPLWAKKLNKNSLKSLFPYNNFKNKIGGIQYVKVIKDKVKLSGYVLK